MNVTKSNFREALRDFYEAIEHCDFITIDTEFTGTSNEQKILPYDSLDHAYRKHSDNANGYIVIQLGVTLIQIGRGGNDDDSDKCTYRSYNFYTFPRSWRTTFRCQGSSIAFLAENGFDFTKLFREGIPYCNQQEEKVLRERLEEKQKQREEARNASAEANNSFNHIPVPDDEKESVERIRKTIEEFIVSSDDEKVIGGCNAFQRKLVYELIEANFADRITATTQNVDNWKAIVVRRRSNPEEENRMERELRKMELRDLEDSIGVSAILRKISASRKPIIGHNMFLDLIFILRQFFRPLPDDLVEFKKLAISIFPNIIDTKYMCTLPKLKPLIRSSVLADLLQTIKDEPFALPDLKPESSQHAYSLDDNKAHEAGYDSYLTSVVFLAMAKHLHGSLSILKGNVTELKEHLNRVFLVKLQDINHIDLAGIEPTPSRDHVFHVIVPEDWKQSDLIQHFRNYGPIFVTWINATSALISLHKKENASSVLKTIGSCAGFKVQSFADFRETLHYRIIGNGNDTITPVHHAKKRKLDGETSTSDEGSHEKRLKKDERIKLPSTTKQCASRKDKGKSNATKVFNESDDWS